VPIADKNANANAQERLESWKEIAAYLNCGERTAKRWEKTRDLPVRRLPGGPSRVFAFQRDVDLWRQRVATEEIDAENEAREGLQGEGWTPALLAQPAATARSVFADAAAPRLHTRPSRLFRFATLGASVALLAFLILGVGFHRSPATRVEAHSHVPSAEARNLYLSGRFYWNKRTPQDLKLAMSDFQAAASIDPQYAAAYAGIADCYALSPEFASMPPQEAYPKMLDAARRALALDPNLAEGHRALAFVSFYWNWDRAASQREFERAIALDNRDPTTYHWFANMLQQSQHSAEALPLIDRARELDPTSPSIVADRGLILRHLSRHAEAAQVWRGLERSDPSYLPPHWYLAGFALQDRDIPVYLEELKAISALTHSASDAALLKRCQKGLLYGGIAGLLDENAKFAGETVQQQRSGYYHAAEAFYEASREEEALRFMQAAYTHRDAAFPLLGGTDVFPRLEGNPRFEELKARSLLPYPDGAAVLQSDSTPALGR
jgi:tetratricopeptide (TPR) repeat protein